MDSTTSVIATGMVVALGRWSQEKKVDSKVVVGVGTTALFLALMSAENPKLGSQFATLILVSAVLVYGVPIGQKLSGKKGK
jgi:hypothetical protein